VEVELKMANQVQPIFILPEGTQRSVGRDVLFFHLVFPLKTPQKERNLG